jgi:zinc protease
MNSMLRSLSYGCLLLLTCISTTAQDLNENLPLDSKIRHGKLDNGITYYIRQNKRPEKKIELRLALNAGSVNEDDNQQGLAHMAEHMAFNGTKNFKKNELISFLQDIGVGFGNDLNAYTSFDETVYMLTIPTDQKGNIEKGFQVLEDWAHQVTYITEDIEGERAIILEESRLGKGAEDRMFRKVFPKLYAGSKYAERLPIGVDSIIRTFNPDEIRRFYKEWYRPELMAVLVVGDIDPNQAEEYIRKHFSTIKPGQGGRPRTPVKLPAYTSDQAMVVTDKEATDYSISINYPPFPQPEAVTIGDYRKSMVRQLYASIFNQRLRELTQQQNAPFLYGYVGFETYARGYSAFSVQAGTGTGDPKKAIDALGEEIERVKRFGFTAAELEREKKSLLTMYERLYNNRDKTESSTLVQEYIRHFLEDEPVPGIAKEYEYAKQMVPTITLDEVNKVSETFRHEKNRFAYVFGPETADTVITDQQVLALLDAKEKADIKPFEEKAVATELLSTVPKAGKVTAKSKNTLLGTTELVLSNGIKVTLKPTAFKDDQVVMGATRPGGKNNYGVADRYNAEYATAIVNTMGVGDFTPTELRKALAGKTVSVSPVFGAISDGVRGSSGKNDIETMLQLNYLYFTSPRKDSSLFRSFVQKNKSQYANLNANPQTAFIDTMYQTLFNKSPLAPIAVPHSEYYDKIDLERALQIYKERFGDATGMNFVFVGSFKESEIIPLIEKYIASLPATGKKYKMVDNNVRPISGKKQLNVYKGKEEQSMILALYTGEIPYNPSLELKAKAMSEVLNIRIFEELREKIQGIYGGGTFISMERYPYSNYNMVLQLPCGPEKVDTLIKAVNAEFDKLVKSGPAVSYLDKVKKQWHEEYRTSIKENSTWLNQLLELKLKGGDPKKFIDYEKNIDKLTVKDIQEAAKVILGGNNKFTAILMPEKYAGANKEEKKAF